MIDGNAQDFVDGLYYGDERVFVYDDMEFFIEGFGANGINCIKIELFVPWFGATYWEFFSDNFEKCVNKFLEAKIFNGKTFWEVEKDITWIDCETDDIEKATEEYYKKHPEKLSYIKQLKKNLNPTKLSDLPKEKQDEATEFGYATLKDGKLYDKDGNIALALNYLFWYFLNVYKDDSGFDIKKFFQDMENERKLFIETHKDKLLKFLNIYCNGNFDKLIDFDLSLLVNDEEFGCPNRNFDCDDTNLMRIIYILLYFEQLGNVRFENFGSDNLYRGDTINSFRTVFGQRVSKNHFLGIEKYTTEKTFLEKVEKFYHTYHTIGNFYLLPNEKFNDVTLNLYRGSKWKDFFDLFLIELKKCLDNKEDKDGVLDNLLKENKCYFNTIKYDFFNFLSFNNLEEYNSSVLYEPHLYHWKYKSNFKEHSKEYIDFANKYIDIASKLINNRSKIIVRKLESLF